MNYDNFLFILISPVTRRMFDDVDDKILGLDGYFKGNIYRYPVFVISFVNKLYRAMPLCFGILNNAKANTISKFLKEVKKNLI